MAIREFDLLAMGFGVGDTLFEVGEKPWTITERIFGSHLFRLHDKDGAEKTITKYGSTMDGSPPRFFPNRFELPETAYEKKRPDLNVDDPIWVRDKDDDGWMPMHFKSWDTDGVIVWSQGTTSHSAVNELSTWLFREYSLTDPTKKTGGQR